MMTRWRLTISLAISLGCASLCSGSATSADDSLPFCAVVAQSPSQIAQKTSQIENATAHAQFRAISDKECESLQKYDIVFVLDHSHSMREILSAAIDGDFVCKWEFVKQQVVEFVDRTSKCLPHESSVVAFNSSVERFDQCSSSKIPGILARMRPAGGTNLSAALNNGLAQRRGREKPLLLLVLTDLSPAETAALSILSDVESINNVAKQGSKLILLPVDGDSAGDIVLRPLGERMKALGKVESFRIVPFSKLLKMGLLRSTLAEL